MGAVILRRARRVGGRGGRSLLLYGVLTLLVLGPLVGLIYSSFQPDRGSAGGLTLDHYRALGSDTLRRATTTTLWMSLIATMTSLMVGGGMAWLVARTDIPGRRLVQLSAMIPLFFSALVGSLAWSSLASPRTGYLNAVFDAVGLPLHLNIYSHWGIIFVLTLYYSPFAFLLIVAAFSLNSGDLEGAARVHGASQWKVARQITFPLVMPSIIAAAILIFILVSENFDVYEILGSFARIDALPTYIFELINQSPPRQGQAAALGVIVMIVLFALVWVQNRFVLRRSYVTVAGKGARHEKVQLGRWRWVGVVAGAVYALLAAVLPLMALSVAAFRRQPFYRDLADLVHPDGYSTHAFVDTVTSSDFTRGLRNTIILAIGAAVLGVFVNFVIAYASRRRAVYASGVIEYVALAPVAMPALLVGLSFVAFWLKLPFSLYGTLTILTIAYVARFIPLGFQGFGSTLVKLDAELEDSAVTSGARRTRAIWSVTLPLLKSTAFSTGLLLFILAFRELTVALFLYTPQTRPLSVVIFNQWTSGALQATASSSLMFIAFLMLVAFIGRRGMVTEL